MLLKKLKPDVVGAAAAMIAGFCEAPIKSANGSAATTGAAGFVEAGAELMGFSKSSMPFPKPLGEDEGAASRKLKAESAVAGAGWGDGVEL